MTFAKHFLAILACCLPLAACGGTDKPSDELILNTVKSKLDDSNNKNTGWHNLYEDGAIKNNSAYVAAENIKKKDGYLSKGGGLVPVGDYVATITFDQVYTQSVYETGYQSGHHLLHSQGESSSQEMQIFFHKSENGWVEGLN